MRRLTFLITAAFCIVALTDEGTIKRIFIGAGLTAIALVIGIAVL